MATYAELLQAAESSTLKNKIRVAVIVAAEIVRTEETSVPDHVLRLAWAKQAFNNPDEEARRMLWAVLAQNRAATLEQITGADDATVQTAVNAAVNAFI